MSPARATGLDADMIAKPERSHLQRKGVARMATDTTQAWVTAGTNHVPSSHLNRQILDL